MTRHLFETNEWSYDMIQRVYNAVETIALNDLGLNIFPNQIEIISSEQMLDAYASFGLPIYYKHWSFGKHFTQHDVLYKKGATDLAYEIVINSSPCISYIMESNSATMQTLVLAHAAFGHNHFFKNNETFKAFSDPYAILDYLKFARNYIAECEMTYGEQNVERLIDAAHALQSASIHRTGRKRQLDLVKEERRRLQNTEHSEAVFNEIWRTVPSASGPQSASTNVDPDTLGLPEDNLLYFIERFSPRLAPWQREIIRIVRMIGQYLYPQRLTKVMNEGVATYVHYEVINRLHETQLISDGAFLEAMLSHTNVVRQPGFDHPGYNGFNPYALGFYMMKDIERIARTPTDEDRDFAPNLAGSSDVTGALQEIWANYRDESFINQFLSPKLIRDLSLFSIDDIQSDPTLTVSAIHNERGYQRIRRQISRQYDASLNDPLIEVAHVDLLGDRRLTLIHKVTNQRRLEQETARRTLQHVADLWGYDAILEERSAKDDVLLGDQRAAPRHLFDQN